MHDNTLKEAVAALAKETGLKVQVLQLELAHNNENQHIDAKIEIDNGVQKVKFFIDVKKRAAQINEGAVINNFKLLNQLTEPNEGILVTDYINPKMAERLKKANVQYLDVVGNVYINQKPLFIYIKGNKQKGDFVVKKEAKTGRAFNATGLKVVFAFLKNKDLINTTYRQIATTANVALGAVGWIIGDLITQGFVKKELDGKHKEIVNYDALLDAWVENYPLKLKPKLRVGTFTTDDPTWWQRIKPMEVGANWGGEIAAAQYTGYLTPKDGTVYLTKGNIAELAKAARLRKVDKEGFRGNLIDVFEKFWPDEEDAGYEFYNHVGAEKDKGLVDPIVAYADLIETGETRNLEVAERLREQYIN